MRRGATRPGDRHRPAHDQCPRCGAPAFTGAPGCRRCASGLDGLIEPAWTRFVHDVLPGASAAEQRTLAEMVTDEPEQHDWRVVDAALDRLPCEQCGGRLSRGPLGCATCNRAHHRRYAARAVDRPDAPAGTEHGLRVAVSVLRRPHGVSTDELRRRRAELRSLIGSRRR